VNIAGSPFNMWAGPFTIAVGAEWRRDKSVTTLNATNTARSLVNAFWAANPQPGSGAQSVKEAYAEIGVPLLKDAPFARNLDLNAAVRATDYSVAGSVTTWKVGATWDITDDIRIRATRSRDIRAPGLTELFYRGNDGFITNLPNPITGLVNPVNNASLNNPNLKPEKADTWTVGAVLQPTFLSGFKASIDYYDINIKGVIGTIPAAIIVRDYYNNSHPEYGQFITFDAGQPSGFRRVDTPQLNLNRQKARGLDINLMYRVPFGESQSITLSSNASRLFQLESFDPSGGSLGDLSNAIPKWRISTNLTYDSKRFSTTLTARYNSSMHYNITLVGPDSPNYNPAAANSVSNNLFPSAVYFSWQAEAKVFDEAGKKLAFFVVVDNLFDKDPPLGAFPLWNGVGANASSAFSPYDSLGRYFKAGVRFQF
jgi:iron complex outermembrane recepter protein